MNKNIKLTEWVINKIKTEYPEDVALLIGVTGHNVNGDGHGECFDYFIPATDRGYELSQTFIIDGIGHDLYPRSWERTERTARLEDFATLAVGNATILYSRSKEEEEKFFAIQKSLYENLKNKEFVYQKALENLNIAMDVYRTMMFEDKLYRVRMAVGIIYDYLSMSVHYLNGTFSADWTNGHISELTKLASLPDNFIEYYRALLQAHSMEELKSLAYLIISASRQFIESFKVAVTENVEKPDFSDLANWYQELSLHWRRIRYYCEAENVDAAFGEACNLQNELNIVGEEFGLKEMDLIGCFHATDLQALSQKATELENYIVSEIENHGVKIRRYDTLEEFLNLEK